MAVSPGFDRFSYSLNNSLPGLNQLPLSNPEETRLYLEQNKTSMFNDFLYASQSDTDSLVGNNGSDFFESSSADPFNIQTDFYTRLISLQTQGAFSDNKQLELFNESAALIGKEAVFFFDGHRQEGLIESVVQDAGSIFFRVGGQLIPMADISEVRGV